MTARPDVAPATGPDEPVPLFLPLLRERLDPVPDLGFAGRTSSMGARPFFRRPDT